LKSKRDRREASMKSAFRIYSPSFAWLLKAMICLAAFALAPESARAESASLELEMKIPLGKVSGRIDHLAIDLERRRLFVAELGNNSVGVVDLSAQKLVGNIGGLKEPQGVAYVKSTDTLYVANAGDGSLRLYQGSELTPGGRIELGDDADNIRVDERTNELFVGYGGGALAVIDPATRAKIGNIPLAAHPESFQLAADGDHIYVNLPEAQQIAAVDTRARKIRATWSVNNVQANFPMAIDQEWRQVLSVFRKPPKVMAFAVSDGSLAAQTDTCGDADDIFVDAKHRRIYVSCGEGFIDVFERDVSGFNRVDRVATASGARTSLFVPELDRFFLAVRATASEQAAVWVFGPRP
jgi:DNA-binding beta-propeller fold protein YncE